MKTTWMIVLMSLFGSFAQAAERVVISTQTIGGVEVAITSEAPVKDGGSISYKHAMAEANAQTYRIASRTLYQLWAASSICATQEYKNLYLRSESAIGQKALNMVSGEVVASDNLPLVETIVCMERPY